MVRPLAGKPIKKRAMISLSVISQAERSRTSWPQWLTEIRPLFPEPFARKEKRLICWNFEEYHLFFCWVGEYNTSMNLITGGKHAEILWLSLRGLR